MDECYASIKDAIGYLKDISELDAEIEVVDHNIKEHTEKGSLAEDVLDRRLDDLKDMKIEAEERLRLALNGITKNCLLKR